MRIIKDHIVNPINDKIILKVMDASDVDGTNHHYRMEYSPDKFGYLLAQTLTFQNGIISEVGINGITQEILIAICIDRLRSFQAGNFCCRESALALTKLEEAQMWLHSRTRSRMDRGVEGTHEI
jgi:hypothetical protein